MAKIECEVEYGEIVKEDGRKCQGVTVTCGACGHVTKSCGLGEGSVRRCLVLLREECPQGEENYYEGDV